MEIKDIKTFQDMENYILERNRTIDCFDSLILQYLIQNMQEDQLVFVPKKDYFHNEPIEKILDWYCPYVQNKYSNALPILRGFISEYNEVWFRIPIAKENPYSGKVNERMNQLSSDYYLDEDGIIWKQEWMSIRDKRMKNRISILYEDDCILIFVIPITVDKVKINQKMWKFEFNHPIYQFNPEFNWQIFLVDHYYHHYMVKGYDELINEKGKDYMEERLERNKEILEFYHNEFILGRKKR